MPSTGEQPVTNGSAEEKSKRDGVSRQVQVAIDKERINFTRNGGNVKRFHTKQIVGEHTNAQHQYNALSLLLILHPNPSIDLIRYVLWHDTAEHVAGDIPAPALWNNAEFNQHYCEVQSTLLMNVLETSLEHLSDEDVYWFECIDKLEVFLFAKEQLSLGNRGMSEIVKNVIIWFTERKPYTVPDEIMDVLANWDDYGIEK